MKKRIYSIFLMCILAACSQVQDSTTHALDTVGNETGSTWNKMRDMLDLGHPPAPKPTKAQPRYCYKTYNDIICYSEPLAASQDYRLVAYQDSSGHTGYVASHEILPSGQPPKTLPKLEMVTVPVPPKIKGTTSPSPAAQRKDLKEIIFDPAELEPKPLVPEKPQ